MSKSTHRAEVVPVALRPHGNADSLSVVDVWGYQCVVRTSDWAGIGKAVYLVPDSLVSVTRPEFAFLATDPSAKADGTYRIKARRLRGVVSQGLLVPAPADAEIGEDWAEKLGVTRYEPPEVGTPQSRADRFVIGGESEDGPDLRTGPEKYDVDAFERYHDRFADGEPCLFQEKLDGSNCRAVFWGGRLWVKTRNRWVKRVPDYSHITHESLLAKGCPEDKIEGIIARVHGGSKAVNDFWQVLERCPALLAYLEANPGTTVYGEIYGSTNRIKYGFADGNRFAAFDVYRDGSFLSAPQMLSELTAAGVPLAPLLSPAGDHQPVPYSMELVKATREGRTMTTGAGAAGTKGPPIREGLVIRPWAERVDTRLGRCVLKAVNPDFHAL